MDLDLKSKTTSRSVKGKLYAFFLAALPVIMMYRTPGIGMGFSTVLIAVFMLYAGVVILKPSRKVDKLVALTLLLYLGYTITKSDGINFLLPIAILVHVAAISTGAVSVNYLRKYVELVSVVAAICVILQQFIHILFGTHIPFIVTGWLTDELSYYSALVETGYGVESMYRPSAFFLEPSHFTQFAIYGLGSALFHNPPKIKKALLISAGLFATTSGMGFVLTFIIWGWWKLTYNKSSNTKKVVSRLIVVFIIGVVLLAVLSQIPFFGSVISRFTVGGESDYNAIDGRLFYWDSLFGGEQWQNFIFGFGEHAYNTLTEDGMYLTGFMKIIYAYGIIGFSLFIIFWVTLLIRVNNSLSRLYVIVYILLLFFANITGFIQIIFNVGVILTYSQFSLGQGKPLAQAHQFRFNHA